MRALIRLYPAAFRRHRADEVEEHALAEWEQARRAGGGASVAAFARLTCDLALGAGRLWLRPARDRRGGTTTREGWMGGFAQDLRFAVRVLRRSPVFTLVAVVTLAIGVGLNVAIFSVVDAVLARPLEYAEADRLVYLTGRLEAEGLDHVLIAGGQLEDFRRVPALESVEGSAFIRQNLTGTEFPSQVRVGWSSPGFLSLLGAEPLYGRLYGPGDPPGSVVLGHALWRDRFGADPGVVGRAVGLDGRVHTVIGVLPPTFRLRLPSRRTQAGADLWKNPGTRWANGDVWGDRVNGMVQVLGRLAPGASVAQAQSALDGVVEGLRAELPELAAGGYGIAVAPLHERVVEGVKTTLIVLLGAVGAVLLIACANVGGLMLTRAQARHGEVALRVALGSSRAAIGRMVVAETLVLGGLGALAGVGVAALALDVIASLGAATVPRIDSVRLDARVLAFGLALVGLTVATVALVPALRAARLDPARGLGRGRASHGSAGARRVVVAGQMALSLVLLAAAGLLTASLLRLQAIDPGFETDDVLTFSVSVPGARYDWPEEADRFFREVEAATAGIPGVASAGVVWPLPLSGSNWSGEVAAVGAEEADTRYADYLLATEAYFGTLGIPHVEGRLFGPDLDPKAGVVVSRSLAERLWPVGSAVGRSLTADPWGRGPTPFEVVGVVEDVRQGDLRAAPEPAVYFDSRGWSWVDWEVDVVARLDGVAAADVVAEVRRAVAALDPEIPVAEVGSLAELTARQTASVRFGLVLLGVFAGAAVLLALTGLYGVTAYAAGRRTREVGIRMALGSARAGVLGLFLREAFVTIAWGIAAGLAGTLLLTRFLSSWLYGVGPTDPAVLALVATALAAAAVLATLIPARRAAGVDPVRALRSD